MADHELGLKKPHIRVGFCTSKGILSRLGQWITGARATHCYISAQLGGLDIILHSTLGGVQVDPKKKWAKHNIILAEFEVLPDVSEGFDKTVSMLGMKYDYAGYFGFIPVFFGRWLGKKWKNPGGSPNAIVCSELLIHLRGDGDIPEWMDFDEESTSPGDLHSRCTAGASFREVSP